MSKNDATLCLVIDFNDFSKHCSIVIGINFSKKFSLRVNEQFISNLAQNCSTLYLMICPTLRTFLRHCSIMRHNRQTIVALVNFSKYLLFKQRDDLGPIQLKIILICHRVFFEIFLHDGIQQIPKVCIVFHRNFMFSTEIFF